MSDAFSLELDLQPAPLCVVIEYRLRPDGPWLLCRGKPGESFADAAAALRRQFPELVEVRER